MKSANLYFYDKMPPLTYERLKAAQDDLVIRYKDYVPKMWVTRAVFEPQFDSATVGPAISMGTIATVNVSIIERGPGYNTAPKWYTKQITYGIHETGFAEPLRQSVWGRTPEAVAYKGALDDWIHSLKG